MECVQASWKHGTRMHRALQCRSFSSARWDAIIQSRKRNHPWHNLCRFPEAVILHYRVWLSSFRQHTKIYQLEISQILRLFNNALEWNAISPDLIGRIGQHLHRTATRQISRWPCSVSLHDSSEYSSAQPTQNLEIRTDKAIVKTARCVIEFTAPMMDALSSHASTLQQLQITQDHTHPRTKEEIIRIINFVATSPIPNIRLNFVIRKDISLSPEDFSVLTDRNGNIVDVHMYIKSR